MSRAPCVAVVGPANSGKSMLLHPLDRALQEHVPPVLTYTVKGNPDGSGRYLWYSPDLRDSTKPYVKGKWGSATVDTILRWVWNCRDNVDLVFLDLGGMRVPTNDAILGACSDSIVLARSFGCPRDEAGKGMAAWSEDCIRNDLVPVARLDSVSSPSKAEVATSGPVLEGTLRGDAGKLDDVTNAAVVGALAQALLTLVAGRRAVPYIDLRLPRRWEPADLADLGGAATAIEDAARSSDGVFVGGAAPIWAYGGALLRARAARKDARVRLFDPKVGGGTVVLPPEPRPVPASPLTPDLRLRWGRSRDGAVALLHVIITTADRFLSDPDAAMLARLPEPEGAPGQGPIVISGAAPTWLHLPCLDWLARAHPGRDLGLWDASGKRAMILAGPRRHTTFPLDLPEPDL